MALLLIEHDRECQEAVSGLAERRDDLVASATATEEEATTPFVVRIRDRSGSEQEIFARAVIDASGTWATPNPVGAVGLPAVGEQDLGDAFATESPTSLAANARATK